MQFCSPGNLAILRIKCAHIRTSSSCHAGKEAYREKRAQSRTGGSIPAPAGLAGEETYGGEVGETQVTRKSNKWLVVALSRALEAV